MFLFSDFKGKGTMLICVACGKLFLNGSRDCQYLMAVFSSSADYLYLCKNWDFFDAEKNKAIPAAKGSAAQQA